ncbi:unnamed protein product [Moneuplotes crassus]|uniref:Cyclic nucleotide-binding domain-containing protein n=1 Tax=Euplotes crassus TaxID=5936 RepID=A0AAD1UAX2_EUPCR|nr:unnamed protein product [Moneuplotes crassus]
MKTNKKFAKEISRREQILIDYKPVELKQPKFKKLKLSHKNVNLSKDEGYLTLRQSRKLRSTSSKPRPMERRLLGSKVKKNRNIDSVSLPRIKNTAPDQSKDEEFKTRVKVSTDNADEDLIQRRPKKKTKKSTRKKNIISSDKPHYLQPINRDTHITTVMTPPEQEEKKIRKKKKDKKKKTQEQIERDDFVEAFLEKNSHVMHVKTQEYGLKSKKGKFKEFNLMTDERAIEHEKHEKQKKSLNKSMPLDLKRKFTQEEKKEKTKAKDKDKTVNIKEETKNPKKSKKTKNLDMAKAATVPTKPEPFLDFEKDLEIGDNFIIESELTKEQLAEWNSLKDPDDAEDLSENELKKIEKKFQYCYKDLNKKKATKLMEEPSLISIEAIVQNHPALKFLCHDQVVNILKERDIESIRMKKQVIPKKAKPDRIYFVLFGLIRLKEATQDEYYGICKVGWPIGEEVLLESAEAHYDTAQAGNTAGVIYITLEELEKIKEGTSPEEYERFIKRLKKFSFLKKIMRKVNLEKDD